MTRPPRRTSAVGRGSAPARPGPGVSARAAEVAADIGRIRRLLMHPELLNHPRINAELDELDQVIAAGLDHRRGRHHRLPAFTTLGRTSVIRDAAGYNLKPDPLTAQTAAELVAALRKYREWAGNPSFRDMAERGRWQVAHSTMCVALKGDALPALKVVVAIVAGCEGDADDQQAFATAWRRISSGTPGVQGLRLVPEPAGTGH